MNHKWKLVLAVFSVFLLLAGASRFVRLPLLGVRPEEAIHHQAALVLSFNKNTLAENQGWQTVFVPKSLQEDLENFEHAFSESLKIEDTRQILASLHPTRTSGADVLFILSGFRGLHLEDVMIKSGCKVHTSLFKNRHVFTVQLKNETFALAKYRNLLLLSTHAYLVENALIQLRNPSTNLCRDANFRAMDKRSKEAPDDLHVLINLHNFSSEFSPVIEASKLRLTGQLSRAGTWLHLQFPANGDASWKGALSAASGNALLQANGQSPLMPYKNVFQAIPANVSTLLWLAIKDYKPTAGVETWDQYFKPWAGNEWAFATGEPAETGTFEQFYLLKSTDDKKAGETLQEFAMASGDTTGYDYQMFKIWTIEGPSFSRIMGLPGGGKKQYLTLLGGYVLAASHRVGMERWLDNYLVGNTFSKRAVFLQTLNALPDKGQGFLYLESGKAWQQIIPFLDGKIVNSLSGNPLQFEHLAAVMKRHGKICDFDAVTPPMQMVQDEHPATVLWRAPLIARAAMPPFVFQNEKTREWLVFLQDEAHQTYLISRGGRVLWSRQLKEPILSEVTVTDLHNNGESQLVFSTASKIFTINMMGEDVDAFPLKLQVPATNGVTVVDFFKSHDYQFFIACENEKAYGFDERGSPVEGWRPLDSTGVVRHPIRHFQARGMDFLVMMNEEGQLKVFQKNGDFRFGELDFGTRFNEPPGYQASQSSARIVACDETGKVFVINFAGENFRLMLKVGDNENVHFAFADIGGDERKDYLAQSGRDLAVYYYKGNNFNRLFTHRFEDPQDDVFAVKWERNQKVFAGTVNKTKNQIFLLDGTGNVLPQFPLAGSTPFCIVDLLNNGKPVLITGFGDSVIAYALE